MGTTFSKGDTDVELGISLLQSTEAFEDKIDNILRKIPSGYSGGVTDWINNHYRVGSKHLIQSLIEENKTNHIRLLKRKGVSTYVWFQAPRNLSSVHLAARKGNAETFQAVLQGIEEVQLKEKIFELAGSQDQSVLNIIISANKEAVDKIEYLKAFVDIKPLLEFKDKTLSPPKNPFEIAVEIGDESLIRKLIEFGSKASAELVQTVAEDSLKALLSENLSSDTEDYQKLMTDSSQEDEKALARRLSRHLKEEMVRDKVSLEVAIAREGDAFWSRHHPTLLQTAVTSRNLLGCKVLLNLGHNPDHTSPLDRQPPIFTAILNKDLEMVKLLMETGKVKKLEHFCPIQRKTFNLINWLLTTNSSRCWNEGRANKVNVEKVREILTYLLDQSEDIRRIVNETGDKDNGSYTPLHHASLMPPGSGIPGIILQFGGSKSLFTMGRNLDGEWWSPVDKLPSDVLEQYFNNTALRPVTTDSRGPLEPKYKVQVDHTGILPDPGCVSEMINVMKLADSGHDDIIDNPVVSSLVWRKWTRICKWIYVSLVLQSVHHLTCTVNAILINMKYQTDTLEAVEVVLSLLWFISWIWLTGSTLRKVTNANFTMKNLKGMWAKILVVLLAPSVMILSYFVQFSPATEKGLSGLLVALCSVCLLQLMRLVLPTRWAVIVKTTDMVAEKMFKFLLVHVVLVAGFTLAFYIQLPDSDAFDDLLTSPFKVLMMFLGEVEYGDSFKEKSFLCQLTLGFFVFGLSIVLMNVLTGVAVVEVETARSSHWLDLADKCLDLDQMAKGPLRRLFRLDTKKLVYICPNGKVDDDEKAYFIENEEIKEATKNICLKQAENLMKSN